MLSLKLLSKRTAETALDDLLKSVHQAPETSQMKELVAAQWQDRTVMVLPEVDLRVCPLDVLGAVLPRTRRKVSELLAIYDDFVVRAGCSMPSPGRALFKIHGGNPDWSEARKWLRPLGSWPFAGGVLLLMARLMGGEMMSRNGEFSGWFGNGFLQVTPKGMFRSASKRFVSLPPSPRSLDDLVLPAQSCRDKHLRALFSLSRSTSDQMRVAILNQCLLEGVITPQWIAKEAPERLAEVKKAYASRLLAIESAYAECMTLLDKPSGRSIAEAYHAAVPRLMDLFGYDRVFGTGPSNFIKAPNRRLKPSTVEGIKRRLHEVYTEAKMRA